MMGLGSILGSLGTIPDILMGKKPGEALKDNLLAAAAVGTGMAALPALGGLLGGAGAAGAGAGAMGPAMGAEVAMGSTIPGLGQYATGYTAQGLMGSAGSLAKAAAPYAQIAQQSGLLGGGQQQPIASPVAMPQAQPSTLPQLSQQIEQSAQAQQQADAERRKRRMSLLGGM